MGLFDKISRGVTRGIGNALGNATQKAVERKATEVLTPKINQAADKIAGNATTAASETASRGSLDGALGNLTNAVNDYATKAAQNMKICPKCDAAVSAEHTFCTRCGEKLPERTLAEGAVCHSCGKQNAVSEKFCADCGTKLPSALAAEDRQRQADQDVLAKWQELLSAYPEWTLGGNCYEIEHYGEGQYIFSSSFASSQEARDAIAAYRAVLEQHGFQSAGQYPSPEHLYKKENGVCYHVDTEHCFEGDANCPTVAFDRREPQGGFDYVKPEPKKKGFFGLFS